MGNNNSNEKEEQIIIQAAGMGSNEAKETAEITRSEWLLITLIVLAVVVVIYLSLKKLIKSLQKMISTEIRRQNIRGSLPNANNTEAV